MSSTNAWCLLVRAITCPFNRARRGLHDLGSERLRHGGELGAHIAGARLLDRGDLLLQVTHSVLDRLDRLAELLALSPERLDALLDLRELGLQFELARACKSSFVVFNCNALTCRDVKNPVSAFIVM